MPGWCPFAFRPPSLDSLLCSFLRHLCLYIPSGTFSHNHPAIPIKSMNREDFIWLPACPIPFFPPFHYIPGFSLNQPSPTVLSLLVPVFWAGWSFCLSPFFVFQIRPERLEQSLVQPLWVNFGLLHTPPLSFLVACLSRQASWPKFCTQLFSRPFRLLLKVRPSWSFSLGPKVLDRRLRVRFHLSQVLYLIAFESFQPLSRLGIYFFRAVIFAPASRFPALSFCKYL